jgi:ribonuclease P protein subunit POP4
LTRQELIGLHARIIRSTHQGYIGMEGPIIMESRNMIVLRKSGSTEVRIPKRSVILEISTPDNQKVRIYGSEIVGRPENRIKMKKRKNARRL